MKCIERNLKIPHSRKILLFLMFASGLLIFTDCKKQTTADKGHKPKDLIPHQQMVDILTDFHFVESALMYNQYRANDIKTESNYYYGQILEKHHISKERFDRSMRYYSYHLEEMEKMYEEIIVNYTKMQEDLKRE